MRDGGGDCIGEIAIVGEKDRLAGRVVLGLAEQVGGDHMRFVPRVRDDDDLARPRDHVDADQPIELALRLGDPGVTGRSEEHTSELQSLMRISYAVFCLKKNNKSE